MAARRIGLRFSILSLAAVVTAQSMLAPSSIAAAQPPQPPSSEPAAVGGDGPGEDSQPDLTPHLDVDPVGDPVEQLDMRTVDSRTFLNPDGTHTTEYFTAPIHYRDADNRMQPIEAVPIASAASDVAFQTKAGPVLSRLGDSSAGRLLTVTAGKYSISYEPVRPVGLAGVAVAADRSPIVDAGGHVVYRNVFPNVDLRYTLLHNGSKEDIILTEPGAPTTFAFAIDAPGLKAALNDDGSIDFADGDETIFHLPAPFMVDSAPEDDGEGARSTEVEYRLMSVAGKQVLVIEADRKWLSDPKRVYPVYIDPTTVTNQVATTDTFISSAYPSSSLNAQWNPGEGGYYELWNGRYDATSGTNYAFVKTGILSGKSVTAATFKVYVQHSYMLGTPTGIYLGRLTSAFSESQTWNMTHPSYVALTSTNVADNQWASFNVTSTARTWSEGTVTNHGFRIYQSSTSQSLWKRLRARENGGDLTTNKPPHMVVTWTNPVATPVTPSGAAWTKSSNLDWTYSANGSSFSQTKFHAQVSTSSTTWSGTPLKANSGEVSSSATAWTAPTTNLVNGTTYYWRVRVYDGHSWSAWTSPQSFKWDIAPPTFTSATVTDAITSQDPNYYDLGNGTFLVKIRGNDANSGIKQTHMKLSNATDPLEVYHDWTSPNTTNCTVNNASTQVNVTACARTVNSSGNREVQFTVVGLSQNSTQTVQYVFTDVAGNRQPSGTSWATAGKTLVFDATVPTGSISNPASGATVGGIVPISGTASDANFLKYELHYSSDLTPSSWTTIGGPTYTTPVTNGTLGTWNTSSLASGGYTIRLRVYDKARAVTGFTEVLRPVEVDNAVPDAEITSPTAGAFVSGSVPITGSVDADTGFNNYTLSVGAGCSPSSWTTITTGSSPVINGALGTWNTGTLEGEHAIRLLVTKTGGLSNTAIVCVTVDNTSPTAIIGSPAVDEFVNGTVDIVGAADDPNFTEYELHLGEGASPSSWTAIGTNPRTVAVADGVLGTWDTSGLAPGTYTLRLRVHDETHTSSGFGEAMRRVIVGDAVNLAAPGILHATGAELSWSPYDGPAAFGGYEIHRSTTAGFTPSDDETLIAVLRQSARTTWLDTSAKPGLAFSYRIVVNNLASHEQRVTLPASGQAVMVLQPTPDVGRVAAVDSAGDGCLNFGAQRSSTIGSSIDGASRALFRFDLRGMPAGATINSATFSYRYEPTNASVGTVNLHRVLAGWDEGGGNGACDGSGATWQDSEPAVEWAGAGTDYATAASASVNPASRTSGGTDSFTITDLVQRWADSEAANHGLVVKLASEPSSDGNFFRFATDDYGLDPAKRPKLTISYTEPGTATIPHAAVNQPADGSTVRGAVTFGATASDDSGVASVAFLVDGGVVATDSAAPFAIEWDSTTVSNGSRALSVRATDNAGNIRTSAAVTVEVDNTAAPVVSLTAPAAGTVSGSVAMAATASDDEAIDRVDFFFDDFLIGSDSSAPYGLTWATLDAALPAFDGAHSLTARAFDAGGQVTVSAPVAVTVANRSGIYKATIAATSDVPAFVVEDDEAEARTEARPTTRSLANAPIDSEPGAAQSNASCDPTGPLNSAALPGTRIDLTVTNDSATAWPIGTLDLWYRWFTPQGEVVFEGPVAEGFQRINAGASRDFNATVRTPALCGSDELAQYRLRFDLWDPAAGSWFAAEGNAPLDRPISVGRQLQVAADLSDDLGLERYNQYWGTDVGAGMGHLVNVANGNSILRWTPFSSPGRGLSTVVDLTYNSLEDHSDSPVGNNWSLAISSLTRLGGRLDIHPNNADTLAGNANRWIAFTDGDGTTHRFDGSLAGDGTVIWDEPPGVNLYLRDHATAEGLTGQLAIDRKWALTRPDGVTFYYNDDGGSPNNDGYPTAVSDRNGNELTFTLDEVPPGEDPGGNHYRVTAVTDAGGRSFTVAYYAKADAHKPQIRGKVRSIADHTGSTITFDYYDDGNLLRLTQIGGTHADGSALADRSFVFSYTTSQGSGPAIGSAPARLAPDPKTNQSNRLFGVIDPRGHETTFSYLGPGAGQERWKLSGLVDRDQQTTAFTYDVINRVTIITAPLSRVTKYGYDTTGKVTSITDPTNRVTSVTWTPDFQVASVDEPGDGRQEFAYNDNGYLTEHRVKVGTDGGGQPIYAHTRLNYEPVLVDDNDVTGKWEPGRTIAHISQLIEKIDPNGMSGGSTTGTHAWTFDYDTRGNLILITDPEDFGTTFTYSATDGTLQTSRDANGNWTTYESYDANGFPEVIREGRRPTASDAPMRSTRFDYDADGLLVAVQDPNHFDLGSAMSRANSTFFDYDAFHRLGRQSAPKSTELEPGQLIWSAGLYDANDNLVRKVAPHYGTGYPGLGAATETTYDDMDRAVLVVGADTSVDPAGERTSLAYDDAGRLTSVTSPKGVATGSVSDDFATLYAYDPLDRIVRITQHEHNGSTILSTRRTHACYDGNDDLVRVTAPNAGLATVNCSQAAPSHTTLFEYDAGHRQTAVVDPNGNRSETEYDDSGNVLSTTNASNDVTIVTYDERNLPVEVRQPFLPGHDLVTRVEYDAVGNRSRLISPRAFDAAEGGTTYAEYVTAYVYDALNRLVRTDLPTSTEYPQAQYVHSAFDTNGNLEWSSLPTTEVTPPTTAAARAAAGTVTTFFDPGWIATSATPDTTPTVHFDYTAEGWQAMRAPEAASGGLNGSEQMFWSYFVDGQLRERTDRDGERSTYRYDANNNMLSAVDASGARAAERTPVEVFANYDSLDQVLKVLQRERRDPPDEEDFTATTYQYDLNGNVVERLDNASAPDQVTAPTGGRQQNYQYDEADWITTQFDRGESGWEDDQRITNTFFPTGWEESRTVARATSSTTWATKQTTEWTYFDNGKLDTLTIRDDAGTPLQSHDVNYLDDDGSYVNGHRTADVFTMLGPDSSAPCRITACTATYEYDPRDRLISHDDGQGTAGATFDYSLDVVGNIVEEQATSGAATATTTYDYLGNQLQSVTADGNTQRYFYDPNGNLACITLETGDASDCPVSTGATPSNQVLAAYEYDPLDRLVGYRSFVPTGSSTEPDAATSYQHDALDRVLAQTESHQRLTSVDERHTVMRYLGLTSLVSGEDHYEGDDSNPGTELTSKSYSYDAFGHRISLTDDETQTGSGGSTDPPAETFTYAYDVHGSVSLLVDESSTATASYGYRPYGGANDALTAGDFDPSDSQEEQGREDNPLNAFRYSGRRLDTGSGSIDMGARRYGPDTGRFLQRDFLSSALGDLSLSLDPLTQGRYNFAGGNPISFVEWDGHVFYANGSGGGVRLPSPPASDPESTSGEAEPTPEPGHPPCVPGTPDCPVAESVATDPIGDFLSGCETDCWVLILSGVETAAEAFQITRGMSADLGDQGARSWRALQNLWNRITGRGAQLRPVALPNSATLGRALERTGVTRPQGAAAHHIVAGRAEGAAPARAVLERFGVSINEAANGVFLPANLSSPNPTGAAVHSTLHNQTYYNTVNSALGQATSRVDVLEILEVLRQDLLRGGS